MSSSRFFAGSVHVCTIAELPQFLQRWIPPLLRPPQIVVAEDGLKQEESEFNAEFIAHLLPKLDWPALRQTAGEVRRLVHSHRLEGLHTLKRVVTMAAPRSPPVLTPTARHRGLAARTPGATRGRRGAAEEHSRPDHGRELWRMGVGGCKGGGCEPTR